MKKTILRSFGGVLAATALLASCSDVYTGGDVSASGASFTSSVIKETAAANATSATLSIVEPSSGISQAASDTIIAVQISSKTHVKESTLSEGIKFYTLKKESGKYYPVRSNELAAKTLKAVESEVSGSTVTTLAIFTLDTTSVKTEAIAVVYDATVLKTEEGYPLLNSDGNLTAGEETDSQIEYISVLKQSDGTATTSLSTSLNDEDFNPQLKSFVKLVSLTESSGSANADGSLTVTTNTGATTYTTIADGTTKYFSGLASKLNEVYRLELCAPGKSAYTKDGAFSFAYDSTNHQYKATSSPLPAGTKYRFVAEPVAITESDESVLLYGHATVWTAGNETNYDYGNKSGVSDYYAASPSYIISTSATTFPAIFTTSSITTAQKGLFTTTKVGDGKYKVVLRTLSGTQLEFGSVSEDGFIVTDANYTKIDDVTVTLKDEKTVSIQLNKSYYSGSVYIWVGEGTTIKTNPVNSAQTTFGIYKDVDYGDASGYVNIYSK